VFGRREISQMDYVAIHGGNKTFNPAQLLLDNVRVGTKFLTDCIKIGAKTYTAWTTTVSVFLGPLQRFSPQRSADV
jgi:hypothetical protein